MQKSLPTETEILPKFSKIQKVMFLSIFFLNFFILLEGSYHPIGETPILYNLLWFIVMIISYPLIRNFFSTHPDNFWSHWRSHPISLKILIGGGISYLMIQLFRLIMDFFLKLHIRFSYTLFVNICIVCTAAIVEELFFRFLLIRTITNLTISKKVAFFTIFGQSLLWSSMHFQYYGSWVELGVMFGIGLYLGALLLYSKSIIFPLGFHILNNILTILYFLNQYSTLYYQKWPSLVFFE